MKLHLNNPNLAINGGTPLRVDKWYDNFSLGEEEKKAAIRSLDSGYLSLFEDKYSLQLQQFFSYLRKLE